MLVYHYKLLFNIIYFHLLNCNNFIEDLLFCKIEKYLILSWNIVLYILLKIININLYLFNYGNK